MASFIRAVDDGEYVVCFLDLPILPLLVSLYIVHSEFQIGYTHDSFWSLLSTFSFRPTFLQPSQHSLGSAQGTVALLSSSSLLPAGVPEFLIYNIYIYIYIYIYVYIYIYIYIYIYLYPYIYIYMYNFLFFVLFFIYLFIYSLLLSGWSISICYCFIVFTFLIIIIFIHLVIHSSIHRFTLNISIHIFFICPLFDFSSSTHSFIHSFIHSIIYSFILYLKILFLPITRFFFLFLFYCTPFYFLFTYFFI